VLSLSDRIFSDHERTVNRVSWHPSAGNIFLSGSQDGTIKLFVRLHSVLHASCSLLSLQHLSLSHGQDLRSQSGCVATFLGKSSTVPVRDVQFSPFHVHLFAAAFDSGVVQLWDTRRVGSTGSGTPGASGSGGAERSWVAHQGLVLGVDWHPSDRGVLATCSRDRTVKVWDLGQAGDADGPGLVSVSQPGSSSSSSQGPPPQRVAIQTIASVGRVQWRPGGPARRAQLASAAALMDSKLHVWDVRRPFVPIASCLGHRDVVTGFAWLADGDAVVSGGKDGRLLLHRLSAAYQPYRHLRTCALSFDVRGRLALVHDPINRAAADM
jgi:WD40 repeat protein